MAGAVGKPAIPDYELVRVIGRGSYGDVWLARSLTGTFRAIKIVWLDRFSDSQPFDREFRGLTEFAAISLVDARQLALLHVGRNDAGGFFYYVMELADDIANGRKIDPDTYLPHTLSELKKRRGRLPAAECVAIGVELAQGLAYLHDSKLVHRDVKPSNVIFVGGLPKLADIGLVSAALDQKRGGIDRTDGNHLAVMCNQPVQQQKPLPVAFRVTQFPVEVFKDYRTVRGQLRHLELLAPVRLGRKFPYVKPLRIGPRQFG